MAPILTLVYRLSRWIQKWLATTLPSGEQFFRLFAHRYIIHVTVFILTFIVTATNLQASSQPTGVEVANRTLLAQMTQAFGEEVVLIEDSTGPIEEHIQRYVYLPERSVSVRQLQAIQSTMMRPISGTLLTARPSDSTPLVSAVRGQLVEVGEFRATTRSKTIEYVVEDGDNVGSIARKFGLNTATVLQSNSLSSRGLIRPGQTLDILPVNGLLYTVRKGDTVNAIAKKYKAEAREITEINGLQNAVLSVGAEIILPEGKLPPAPPRRVATNFSNIFVPKAANLSLDTQLLWPTTSRRITQYFRWRHYGLDIGGPMREPIFAADNGVVINSGWNRGGYGNMILIDHGNGLFTRYAHMTKLLVSVGDRVERGQSIGLLGSTGRSTGPHLHFEVAVGSATNRKNPLDYIR